MNSRIGMVSGLACILLLGGCATSDDPREGGFFGGVSGISSGAYDERVRTREERLAALRAAQQDLAAEQGELDRSRSEAEQVLAAEQRRLAALQGDIDELDGRVARLAAEDDASAGRIAQLRTRIDSLQQDMTRQQDALDSLEGSGISDSELDRRRRELLAQREALRKEYDLLMSLTMDLAR
ncbi:MAG: hypothetical protein ACLFSG_04230 [Halothiobacillaceae bacterium]